MTETHKETEVSGFEIKVKNISWDAKQEDVEAFLKTFTSVEQVKLLVNRKTGRSKGYAYATLTDQAALNKALEHKNLDHQGRTLQIVQAKAKGEKSQQQEEQQEQYKQKQTSLYIGNLAVDTTEQQVRDLFSGLEVKNVKIVTARNDQSKVYGFVDFNDNSSVVKALEKNASNLNGKEIEVNYKRQKQQRNRGQRRPQRGGNRDGGDRQRGDGQPRRLENNRPQRRNYDRDYDRKEGGGQRRNYDRPQNNDRRQQGQQREQNRDQDSSSIYVGNLDFHTDEQTLREVFDKSGQIEEVRIVTDRNSGRSKGFGFINFSNAQGAKRALELDGEEVDGRQIKVDLQTSRQQGNDRQRGGDNYRGGDRQVRRLDNQERRGDNQERRGDNNYRGGDNQRGGDRRGRGGERRGQGDRRN